MNANMVDLQTLKPIGWHRDVVVRLDRTMVQLTPRQFYLHMVEMHWPAVVVTHGGV